MQRSSRLWLQQRNTRLYLIKSYLLLLSVNERGIEPIVIKKANQFVSSKFGDVQLLHIKKFPEKLRAFILF